MKFTRLCPSLLALSLVVFAQAETWTAADGERTMEADFVKLEGDQVTMMMSNGQLSTFALSMLSNESQERIKELAAAQIPAEQAEKSEVQEDFGTRLRVLNEDERMVKFEFEENPQYFILYYSASWCPPCRNMAPTSVKYYNKTIAENSQVEMIMVSSDNDRKAAEAWAKKEKMPWPILLSSDRNRVDVAKDNSPRGIPHMVLVDGQGEAIAVGTQAVKKKVNELIKKGTKKK